MLEVDIVAVGWIKAGYHCLKCILVLLPGLTMDAGQLKTQ